MSKYIIELEDDIKYLIINGKADNRCYTLVRPVDELEVLNSDYINEHYGQSQDEAYQRGLEDAWEAARRIVVDTDHGGIATGTLGEIFGMQGYSYIMQYNTAQEAIEKLKAYEDGKHSDRIEVGDEVEWEGEKFTILRVFTPKGCYEQCDGFDDAGNGYTNILTKDVKKTGKHYDIQSILEAMRTND